MFIQVIENKQIYRLEKFVDKIEARYLEFQSN
ncbi:hypothetical protein TH47_05490 [Thalassospira sp. MCCC 1A02803]|nr:hypothetical protein TH47_05490 [Thalassospira sp. MCCC 1A02803]